MPVTPGKPRPGRFGHVTAALRILVVEDEPDIAGLIKHALERDRGAAVSTVNSADDALRAVAERVPDLVILDLNLPVMSGTEVCRLLRSSPATRQVPIIMLTARTSAADRVTGLDLGADDYVTKPFSIRELAARVRAGVRRRQEGPDATAAAPLTGRSRRDPSTSMSGACVRSSAPRARRSKR